MLEGESASVLRLDARATLRLLQRLFPFEHALRISPEGLTVWLNAEPITPCEKFIRVDIDPDRHRASALPNALLILGFLAPAIKTPGYAMCCDLSQTQVSLRLKPRKRNNDRRASLHRRHKDNAEVGKGALSILPAAAL